jgi:hypothetical protein
MALNEEEQRILQEIERSFYESDPAFADRVRSETVYRHAGRNLKWAIITFVLGLAFTVATFTASVVLGAIGFLVMLGSAYAFERNLRRIGRASLSDMARGARGPFRSFPRRMRGPDEAA